MTGKNRLHNIIMILYAGKVTITKNLGIYISQNWNSLQNKIFE